MFHVELFRPFFAIFTGFKPEYLSLGCPVGQRFEYQPENKAE
jgi:hypothetical protein